MTDAAKPKLTEQGRLAKMRAGREASAAEVRGARADVLTNTDEFINSPEFRSKHKTNSVVKRVFDDQWALREKYKINPDGTAMTIEDEIAHRNARGVSLSDRQRKAVGLPTNEEEKAMALAEAKTKADEEAA